MAIRVGVIGLGVGEKHVAEYRNLPGVEVAAVVDAIPDRASAVAARCGARAYTDALAMLDGERLDAVSVCTPPRSHCELTVAAARRGVHVLCEKPMAPGPEECDTMIDACEHAGVTLLLGFKKRSSPAFRLLKEQVGEWGPLLMGQVRFQLGPVPKAWFWDEADGGGPLIENAAHALDMLRFLFGDAERVYAEGANHFSEGRDIVAAAACTLRFRAGGMVTLAAGTGGIWGYDASERWVLNYQDANAELVGPFDAPRSLRVMRRDGREVEERWWQETTGWPEQMAHFVECVRGAATPRATGMDGKRALQLGLAIKQSARTRLPVTVP
ncbi:MAG: Gfo/Idh/MocA family protein [Anaerolineae bacterium]